MNNNTDVMPKICFFLLFLFLLNPFCRCAETDWVSINTDSLKDWTVPKSGGEGKVTAKDGILTVGLGQDMTGVRYKKNLPDINYELTYEARRKQGSDFFAACTFSVKKAECTLVNGGWGGSITGISSINGSDASENETSVNVDYEDGEWYKFRIRVTGKKIQVWATKSSPKLKEADEKLVIDLETEDKKFSVRFEMDDFKPLAFCSWASEGEIKNIKYREIKAENKR